MLATRAFQRLGAVWLDNPSVPIFDALAEGMGPAHHAGTTRMGPAGDERAVVGPDLKVHGFDNLRVADTGVYPDNVMHNTNLTAMVVGEVAARLIGRGNAPPRGWRRRRTKASTRRFGFRKFYNCLAAQFSKEQRMRPRASIS